MTKRSTLLLIALASPVAAQNPTYIWSPPGAQTNLGGTNNTIPFWGVSATYQQIHDPETMPAVLAIQGMALRNAGRRTITGRSMDLHLRLGQTNVEARKYSRTFATNLQTNTKSVFGTAAAFKKFSFASYTSTATPPKPSFVVPFAAPYVYLGALGGVTWEWRHKNCSSTASMPMDCSAGRTNLGRVSGLIGKGCAPAGTSQASRATGMVANTPQGYVYRMTLIGGSKSSPAALAIGVGATANIGWCTSLQVNPLAFVFGATDATGAWTLEAPLLLLAGLPTAQRLVSQFAWADATLPAGMGLSDATAYTTPNCPGAHGMIRTYAYSRSSNGSELATNATGGSLDYGLVIGWQK